MSKTSPSSSRRTMSRAGRFDIKRIAHEQKRFRDLYHYFMRTSWPRLICFFSIKFILINLLFALAYYLGGAIIHNNAKALQFWDYFFFSVQTFSTIGYGSLSPVGLYANVLVTVEALVGILSVALTTGIFFAKFSRPTARVNFTDCMVIKPFDGIPTLMLRVANMRANQIIEATGKITFIRTIINAEGESMRRFFDIPLVRESSPMLSISWTMMHTIDRESPMYGLSAEDLEKEDAFFVVTLSGIDETVVQSIHAQTVYSYEDIRWNHKFADMLRRDQDNELHVDYSLLNEVEEL